MAAFAALVAGTMFIVYAYRGDLAAPSAAGAADQPTAATETAKPKKAAPALAEPKAPATPQSGTSPVVLYDFNALPDPIKNTLQGIVEAAQSGNIDEMLPVLQENELPPMLAAAAVSDPIAFWKKASADGEGRDILAAMLNVFSSGFVRTGEGKDAIYVWPYFAEIDLSKLTPAEEVELFRIVPPAQALEMKKTGKYTYYRAGIGGDGVWHYFLQ
jgi:hypothetical protein